MGDLHSLIDDLEPWLNMLDFSKISLKIPLTFTTVGSKAAEIKRRNV